MKLSRRPSLAPFRLQAAVIAVASISLCTLAILVIEDALGRAERTIAAEATQQCSSAARELLAQYTARDLARDENAGALPFAALDISLHGLSTAVLSSYEGVHGGYLTSPDGRIAGYSRPAAAEDFGRSEIQDLQDLGRIAMERGGTVEVREIPGPPRTVAVAVADSEGNVVALAAKRMPETTLTFTSRQWWLALLVLCALIGLAGVISISVRLGRGVRAVQSGISKLESDFTYRLPQTGAEFQSIVDAVNRMAERRSALESSIRRQDRLAALGRVVSGVAHEIRNPLNGIRLSMELLSHRVSRGNASTAEINAAIQEVDRLEQILSRLLQFGRIGQEERRIQEIVPIVERAVNLVSEQAHRKGVRIDSQLLAPDIRANVDALEMEQVVMNLLLNALDVSQPGGAITVEVTSVGPRVRISVRDEGPGVPAEAREHLFDPYFTTKETGNGLGLAVSRDAILRHQGSIDYRNTPSGTEFWFDLPAHPGEVLQ